MYKRSEILNNKKNFELAGSLQEWRFANANSRSQGNFWNVVFSWLLSN